MLLVSLLGAIGSGVVGAGEDALSQSVLRVLVSVSV